MRIPEGNEDIFPSFDHWDSAPRPPSPPSPPRTPDPVEPKPDFISPLYERISSASFWRFCRAPILSKPAPGLGASSATRVFLWSVVLSSLLVLLFILAALFYKAIYPNRQTRLISEYRARVEDRMKVFGRIIEAIGGIDIPEKDLQKNPEPLQFLTYRQLDGFEMYSPAFPKTPAVMIPLRDLLNSSAMNHDWFSLPCCLMELKIPYKDLNKASRKLELLTRIRYLIVLRPHSQLPGSLLQSLNSSANQIQFYKDGIWNGDALLFDFHSGEHRGGIRVSVKRGEITPPSGKNDDSYSWPVAIEEQASKSAQRKYESLN